jgi:NAD(P)-dependent dehydrogenase (short-subunit alcohol dehydrogenase family)
MSGSDETLLAGRHALIVGDDEIGCGIAERLRRAGAHIKSLSLSGPQPPPAADIGIELDVLVLNVLPAAAATPLATAEPAATEHALARVVLAQRLMQACLPALSVRGGRILLIGHRYGEAINEGLAAYNCAAWALVGLMRTAAIEWGPLQITTNLVLPLADTAELRAALSQRPRVVEQLIGQLPLGRVGCPLEDVGSAVAFLASDAAAFINGEIVYADGGQHVAGPVLNPSRFMARTSG